MKQKKMLMLFLIIGLLLVMVACDIRIDEAAIERDIAGRIDLFQKAVEDYDVEGMLGFLAVDGFSLELTEDGESNQDIKDFALLKKELKEDEEKQLRWRQNPPAGHGYILTMELGTITFSNISEAGAIVSFPFSIYEEAQGIVKEITDSGTIVCEMIKIESTWSCLHMTINFACQAGKVLNLNSIFNSNGFGFSKFALN